MLLKKPKKFSEFVQYSEKPRIFQKNQGFQELENFINNPQIYLRYVSGQFMTSGQLFSVNVNTFLKQRFIMSFSFTNTFLKIYYKSSQEDRSLSRSSSGHIHSTAHRYPY